ncbi:peptide chain release factor N(5)-glutamine methyltransferase [Flaviaesturariibacter flavus]|uniref:Release factor glutamine methyltransferase n=1 Tax=Flaviaesturariibacter flavus TaxID=2502780 RepID=A0A4R1BJF2_9BACT|nr:peptide chain release factor N(5)-glutamine methyltransferase [Flaviaesturariibacter flavus]TCJ17495.1 peptide chain release factor N(5)-glutamine methyltransferase [Flaviaesturariibacter flavus]
MKNGEAEAWLRNQLESMYDPGESAAIAALALEHVTGLRRGEWLLRREEPLSGEEEQALRDTAARLLRQEPIQYISGRSFFYGLELYVNPSVLIPRPETEELVDWIVKDLLELGLPVFDKKETEADATALLKILDVGTGSGCIALALKSKMPRAEVWGCDVSDEALNVARRNGSDNNIRVDFQGVDFLDEAQQRLLPSVDVLVSNPPYIPLKDKTSMHSNVVEWEPHTALFVPDNDALLFYRAIARFAPRRLHAGGRIYLEIHEDLGNAVVQLFREAGYESVELRKDMQGKDRMVRVIR